LRCRILHIIYSLYRGGAERLIETQILVSKRRDYEIVVCSLAGGGDLVEAMETAGARVFLLSRRHKGTPASLLQLIGLIRRESIDLLHLHNSPGALWGTLAAVLGGLRIPIVRTEHCPYLPGSVPLIYRVLYPYLSKRAARIICVSDSARETFIDRFPALADRYTTIHNGIRPELFDNLPPKAECRQHFNLPAKAILLGTVGHLVPVKNQIDLIEALRLIRSRVPEAHLAIMGEGELETALKARASSLGVSESLSLIPATPRVELFFGALDIFALSSRSEGMPLTLLEAMAAGLPVVATRVGGIPEVIEHGETGYLVPAGSPPMLAEQLSGLILNHETALEKGLRGRERVQRRFTAERMVTRIEKVYDEVLGIPG
jgi:glycosyltransferase involved in cell wall biosynthesis